MTKQEELEKRVLTLEELCEQDIQDSAGNLDELAQAKKELKDFNKPELTSLQFDNLYEAVEKGVSNFDFSDEDNYDKEFELDYDGRVQLSNFDFTNQQELVEMIVHIVNELFVEAEELDTTEADNHA